MSDSKINKTEQTESRSRSSVRMCGPDAWPVEWGPAPAWATRRDPSRRSYGPQVARLAAHLGMPLFPWQRYAMDVGLEVDSDGGWVYDEVVVTTPRQAGKSFLLGPLVGHRCTTVEGCSAWLTAQKGRSIDRWGSVARGLKGTRLGPMLTYRYGNANEKLAFPNGSTFRPFPPTPEAMHGESPDLVLIDELWVFSGIQRQLLEESYRPAWSVKPGQSWLLSTAGTQRSEWLNQVRRAGREAVESGRNRGRAYFEWSAPETVAGTPLIGLEDDHLLDVVAAVHPRRDHSLRRQSLQVELERRPRAQWIRDYANLTVPDEDEQAAFPAVVMERARSSEQIPGDARIALSVTADPDRRDAAVGVAWRNPSGVAITSEHFSAGTRWVAGTIIRLVDQYDVACVAVRNAGAARSIADELQRVGVPLLRVSQQDYAAACTRFADEISADRPSITWDSATTFTEAVAAAEGRQVPSGQVWQSRSGGSISCLEARTLAVWAVDHAPEPEPRIDPAIW